MGRLNYLAAAVLALWTFQVSNLPIPAEELSFQLARHTSMSQGAPFIANAFWRAKDLIVVGRDFDQNAVILVNGIEQKTEPDVYNPTIILISKKARKRLESDQIATVQVQNGEGSLSQHILFYTGITISFSDSGTTIKLKVGDRFLLRLADSPAVCSFMEPDPMLIRKLDIELPPIVGAKGWYIAEHAGQTSIWASCSVPCPPGVICPGGGPAVLQAMLKVKQ